MKHILKKNIAKIFSLFLLLFCQQSFAQANLLNAKTPDQIGVKSEAQKEADNDQPLPYGYVDDRDIMWSTTTWEIIDLEQRLNFPLLFPVDTIDISSDRRSLYDDLIRSMK